MFQETRGRIAAADVEGDHSAKAGHLAFRDVMSGVILKSRIVNFLHRASASEIFRDGHGVRYVPVHAHPQRLDALQEQKRIEGAEARSDIAQALDARSNDERDGSEHFAEVHAVVRLRWLIDLLDGGILAAFVVWGIIDFFRAHRGREEDER